MDEEASLQLGLMADAAHEALDVVRWFLGLCRIRRAKKIQDELGNPRSPYPLLNRKDHRSHPCQVRLQEL